MRVDLLDSLRCPRAHEEIWLVASYTRRDEVEMFDGLLGCPVCATEYAVRDGVAALVVPDEPAVAAPAEPAESDPDAGLRLAAMLDLGDERGVAILSGGFAAAAEAVRAVSPTPLLVIARPGSAGARPHAMDAADAISRVASNGAPIARAFARAAALDDSLGAASVERLVAAVRPGGRIVGPVSLEVPPGCREIARDASLWVAERETAPAGVISIASRRRNGAG